MNEFERVWKQFELFTENAELKECCELFYRKGIWDGKDEIMKEIRPLVIPPEAAVKLENATIGETINYAHLGQVLEAKKHIS